MNGAEAATPRAMRSTSAASGATRSFLPGSSAAAFEPGPGGTFCPGEPSCRVTAAVVEHPCVTEPFESATRGVG